MKILAAIANISVNPDYRLSMWADGRTPNQVDFTDEAKALLALLGGKKESRIILPFWKGKAENVKKMEVEADRYGG